MGNGSEYRGINSVVAVLPLMEISNADQNWRLDYEFGFLHVSKFRLWNK